MAGLKRRMIIMKNENLLLQYVCEMYKIALDLDKQYIKGLEEAISEQKQLIDGLDKEIDKDNALLKTANKMIEELMQDNENLKEMLKETNNRCSECSLFKNSNFYKGE